MIKEILHFAWQGIGRNKLLSLGLFLTAFLLSLFFIGVRSVGVIINENITYLSQNVDLTLFLKKDIAIDNPLVLALQKELKEHNVEVSVLTPEMALKRLKDTTGVTDLIDETLNFVSDYQGENVLDPIIIIKDFSHTSPEDIAALLGKDQYQSIVDSSYTELQLQRIQNFKVFAMISNTIFFMMYIFFLVVAALMVYNTTRLLVYSRQREIEVMDLVGAGKAVLEGPFYAENLIVTLSGVLLSVVLFTIMLLEWNVLFSTKDTLPDVLANITMLVGFLSAYLGAWWFLEGVVLFLLFGLVSLLSTFVALRSYLPKV